MPYKEQSIDSTVTIVSGMLSGAAALISLLIQTAVIDAERRYHSALLS